MQNNMYACTDCRVGGKNPYPACTAAGHNVICLGRKITVPKKNNSKAWKRIEQGDYYWDDKKVARNPYPKKWYDSQIKPLREQAVETLLEKWR